MKPLFALAGLWLCAACSENQGGPTLDSLPGGDTNVRLDRGSDFYAWPPDEGLAPDQTPAPDTRPGADKGPVVDKGGATDKGTLKDQGAGPDAPPCGKTLVSFVGKVATVAGTPLGLTSSAYNQPVSGKLGFLLCVPDKLAADPLRAEYDHDNGGVFELTVMTASVTGSQKPIVQVENLNPDTFRFIDGKQLIDPKTRTMLLNGQPSPTLSLWIAITDSGGAAFTSDAAPAVFPFSNMSAYPHTFSVKDSGGTLLLQLSSMTQI